MTLRRRSRVDANQSQLVKEIRAVGYSVLHLHVLKNCFDILVGAKGKNFAFEIKDGSKVKSKKKLTEGERKFLKTWKGQINVAECLDDVLKVIEKG